MASKKLVNRPDDCVEECLTGLVAVHPGLQLVEGSRVVVRSDIDEVKARGQVTLLSGGGSGHEPAFAGYVGPGMLSAAVPGQVFASPPPANILAGLEVVGLGNPAGVLVMVLNYTGDRLNFGMAVENARNRGIKVKVVTVGEDCALSSHDRTAGRRGLTGAIFIMKIAGALAESGKSLDEIHDIVTEAATKMGTIGLSLSSCSVPGRPPTFSLAPDEMELGLGVHGEAGVRRMKLCSAKEAVAAMLSHMTNPESSTHLPVKRGDHVALLVNNLGGTSQLEMGIIVKEAIAYLENVGVVVDRAYCGSFITSMEMAGVMITVLHVDDTLKHCLDEPTSVFAWVRPLLAPGQRDRVTPSRRPATSATTGRVQNGVQCPPEVARLIFRALTEACQTMVANETELNQLDSQSGDGDCGTTFKRGSQAVQTALGEVTSPGLSVDRPYNLMCELSDIAAQTMGGTSGALYSLLFSACAGPLLSQCDVKAWIDGYKSGMDAIIRYGRAQVGDRTMLDSMHAGYEALVANVAQGPLQALSRAVEASREGAAATAGMAAHAGRASYVHADHLTQPDPGAVAFSLWLGSVYDALKAASV